jgi:hypothetical protein
MDGLKETTDSSVSMTEKGALQMLYDLQFLSKLLQAKTDGGPLEDVISSVKRKVNTMCLIHLWIYTSNADVPSIID